MSVERIVAAGLFVKLLEVNWIRKFLGYWALFTLIVVLYKFPVIWKMWLVFPIKFLEAVLTILLMPVFLLVGTGWFRTDYKSDRLIDWAAGTAETSLIHSSSDFGILSWVFIILAAIAFFNWVVTFSSDYAAERNNGKSWSFIAICSGLAFVV